MKENRVAQREREMTRNSTESSREASGMEGRKSVGPGEIQYYDLK